MTAGMFEADITDGTKEKAEYTSGDPKVCGIWF